MAEALSLKAGKNIPAAELSEMVNDTHPYPCYGGNNIRGYTRTYNRSGKFPIIGRQGALCGNICLATGDFYATEHAVVVEARKAFDIDFLYYLLISMNLNQYKTVGAQPGLSVERLNKVRMPVPPLELQCSIAEKMKRYTAQYEELVSAIQEEIKMRSMQYSFYRDQLLTFKKVA